jgi:uncharacterized protein
VACARSRPEVDPRRVVLWGTSFGGGHVLATAAQDPAVAAVIAQGPFTDDGVASALAMRPDSSVKVMARAVRDVAGARLGRPPVMVATAGPPGSAALMTAADAEPGYLALVPGEAPFANQVAARSALDIIRYRPGRQTAKIACPVLFCVCEHDSVAPARPTLRHARRAPRGEVRLYPDATSTSTSPSPSNALSRTRSPSWRGTSPPAPHQLPGKPRSGDIPRRGTACPPTRSRARPS